MRHFLVQAAADEITGSSNLPTIVVKSSVYADFKNGLSAMVDQLRDLKTIGLNQKTLATFANAAWKNGDAKLPFATAIGGFSIEAVEIEAVDAYSFPAPIATNQITEYEPVSYASLANVSGL